MDPHSLLYLLIPLFQKYLSILPVLCDASALYFGISLASNHTYLIILYRFLFYYFIIYFDLKDRNYFHSKVSINFQALKICLRSFAIKNYLN